MMKEKIITESQVHQLWGNTLKPSQTLKGEVLGSYSGADLAALRDSEILNPRPSGSGQMR